jgi:hypothetical protein
MRRREAVLDLYNSALGAFLFISPSLFAFPLHAMRLDAWISGGIVILVSIITLFAFSELEEWVNFLTGAWITLSPLVLGFEHTTAMHICIGVGAVIIYLSILELWYIHFSFATPPTFNRN